MNSKLLADNGASLTDVDGKCFECGDLGVPPLVKDATKSEQAGQIVTSSVRFRCG